VNEQRVTQILLCSKAECDRRQKTRASLDLPYSDWLRLQLPPVLFKMGFVAVNSIIICAKVLGRLSLSAEQSIRTMFEQGNPEMNGVRLVRMILKLSKVNVL
jgi:hypothetical protein